MPTIEVCNSHQAQGYPSTIEGTPLPFDLPEALSADLAVDVPQPGGIPRTHLDCHDCRWLLDSVAEQALGSVGNPSLAKVWDNPSDAKAFDPGKPKTPKKEKTVAKTPESTTRVRRKPVDTWHYGNISVSIYIEGLTPENFAALTLDQALALHEVLSGAKAETPKGA